MYGEEIIEALRSVKQFTDGKQQKRGCLGECGTPKHHRCSELIELVLPCGYGGCLKL